MAEVLPLPPVWTPSGELSAGVPGLSSVATLARVSYLVLCPPRGAAGSRQRRAGLVLDNITVWCLLLEWYQEGGYHLPREKESSLSNHPPHPAN